MKHVKIEIDFIPVEEKPMPEIVPEPNGHRFFVLFQAVKKDLSVYCWMGLMLGGVVWNPNEQEGETITHWAEIPEKRLLSASK